MQTVDLKVLDGSNEKHFTVSKMSALQAEQWFYRAAFALGSSLDDVQEIFKGNASDMIHAILSVPYEKAKPLLDDLLACCTLVNGKVLKPLTSDGACALIESPLTLTRLRIEALRLNFGFFFDGDALSFLTGQSTETPA